MGIRRRIALGFTALAFLLFIAGLISYFEISRLNETTQRTIDAGALSISTAKDILDLIEKQDVLVLKELNHDTLNFRYADLTINSDIEELTNALVEQFGDDEILTIVLGDMTNYNATVTKEGALLEKSQALEWYFTKYRPAYRNLAHSIKDFMVLAQNSVVEKTNEIGSLAYRATMQGITALAAAIVIILLFYFMIDTYFVRPVTQMTSSLKHHLLHRTPFDVKFEGREDVHELQGYIKQLLSTIATLKKERNSTPKC
ncbi:MAG: MCP four helix bundle domain-containing protein [Rikenellaceae bacterium]